jgi:hypothetical protein
MREQFGAFTASELYCPKCRKSQPVRERLLLVLPTGELHEYLCSGCGQSLGERTVSVPTQPPRPIQRRQPTQPPRRLLR